MSDRTEALRDELRAIEIWDDDYRRCDNPPFIDILAWRARRQREAEIQCELERVGSAPGNESTDTSVLKATLYDQGCNGLELENPPGRIISRNHLHVSRHQKSATSSARDGRGTSR
jgi:hypothetical protein